MMDCKRLDFTSVLALLWAVPCVTFAQIDLEVTQITQGPQSHFFGYIGHVQNIPWNGSGRYIVALRTSRLDKMPGPENAADIVLIDTQDDYKVRAIETTRAWNPQQGTMFYWNPEAPDTQFFFNDRDQKTGNVFCVLFDISKNRRQREYRFEDSPIGNGGVAQGGGSFLGINYGRMARLRPVTGYRDATDWTDSAAHPDNDGVFKVNVKTGRKELLVSFLELADRLRQLNPSRKIPPLFINHTLWNREGDRVFFFARGGWEGPEDRINQAFVMHADGALLKPLAQHIGGHPEWDLGHRLIGRLGNSQIIFDVDRQQPVAYMGDHTVFPDPEGDIALSPDGKWFVNGHKDRQQSKNYYTVYRRQDGAYTRSKGFDIGKWASGDLRQDPSPCWNRDGTKLLVPGVVEDGSRQLFVIKILSQS